MMLGFLAVSLYLAVIFLFKPLDPQPAFKQLTFQQSDVPISAPPHSETTIFLETPPSQNLSVVATAVFVAGEIDSSYGLIFKAQDGRLLKIGLSPTGQAMILNGDTAVLPWQPWPHVHQEDIANELWVDIIHDQMIIRLNQELLWRGEIEPGSYEVGLFAQSFGTTAQYTFSEIQQFTD